MPRIYDAAIIGASIAGAALALRLGECGLSVALIDRSAFPRSKSCGEGLSGGGVAALERLGFSAAVLREGSVPFCGYTLRTSFGRSIDIHSPDQGIGISREKLDSLFHSRLTHFPTVTVMSGIEVAEVDPILGSIRTNRSSLKANVIVDAASVGDYARGRLKSRFGVTFHARCAVSPVLGTVQIALSRDGELFCTQVERDRFNLSFLGFSGRSPGTPQIRDRMSQLLGDLGCEGVSLSRPIGAALVLGRRNAVEGTRLLRIGDAVERFDPIGGMGMTHALRTAEAAARAVLSIVGGCSHAGSGREGDAWKGYAKERERIAAPYRAFTAATYYGLRLLARTPAVPAPVIRMAGTLMGSIVHAAEPEEELGGRLAAALGGVL